MIRCHALSMRGILGTEADKKPLIIMTCDNRSYSVPCMSQHISVQIFWFSLLSFWLKDCLTSRDTAFYHPATATKGDPPQFPASQAGAAWERMQWCPDVLTSSLFWTPTPITCKPALGFCAAGVG